jgi:hypothetical protein
MATCITMDESDLPPPQVRITSRLIDALYTEAMVLADEARSYFDDVGRNAQDSDPAVVTQLPPCAQRLINSSADLYARVKRIDDGSLETEIPQSPARALMGRLERGLVGDNSASG